MTRLTARASCSRICAMDSSATAVSPRRSSASQAWAFWMARSPPLTATYISKNLRTAGQRRDAVAAGEEEIQPQREQQGVVLKGLCLGQVERCRVADAGAGQGGAFRAQVHALDDQRGRAIRVFGR